MVGPAEVEVKKRGGDSPHIDGRGAVWDPLIHFTSVSGTGVLA